MCRLKVACPHKHIIIQSHDNHIGVKLGSVQSWALSVFLNFFNNKKRCFAFFIKLITYFCTIPIEKAHFQ